jgi:hypothetical protein
VRADGVGTLTRSLRQVPVTIALVSLVVMCACTVRWLVPNPDAVELWASTNLVNLRHHPGAAMVASAFFSDSVPSTVLVAGFACGMLERRVGWRRMLVVISAGHVVASLVTEGAVRLAILRHADSRAAASQLDIGISYVAYSALGAALCFIPPRWRRLAVAVVALDLIVQLAITPTMTAWGHVLSLLIGLLFWPMLRTGRWPAPARHAVGLRLAALGALAAVGLVTAYAPGHVLRRPYLAIYRPTSGVLVSRITSSARVRSFRPTRPSTEALRAQYSRSAVTAVAVIRLACSGVSSW